MATAREGDDVNQADQGRNKEQQKEGEEIGINKGPDRVSSPFPFQTLLGASLGAGKEGDEIPAPKKRHCYPDVDRQASR